MHGFLAHAGVIARSGFAQGNRTTTLLDMPDSVCYTTSEHSGLLEMCHELGDFVKEGDVLARVYDATRTGAMPVEYIARRGGLLAARHFPGLVQIGDTVAVVADVIEENIPVLV